MINTIAPRLRHVGRLMLALVLLLPAVAGPVWSQAADNAPEPAAQPATQATPRTEPQRPPLIEKRVQHMRTLAKDMKLMIDMLGGARRYDAALMRKALADITSNGGAALIALFPQGSLDKTSRAKPSIWQDMAAFRRYAMAIGQQAKQLRAQVDKAAASGVIEKAQAEVARSAWLNIDRELLQQARNQLQPMREQFRLMAENCRGCHEKFRVPAEEER